MLGIYYTLCYISEKSTGMTKVNRVDRPVLENEQNTGNGEKDREYARCTFHRMLKVSGNCDAAGALR